MERKIIPLFEFPFSNESTTENLLQFGRFSTGSFVGVDGVARTIKAIYIGDQNGIARKVKNVYIGVDGYARKVDL